MNKFVIVALAFTVVAVSAQGPPPRSEEFMKYMEECKVETGATDNDLKNIMKYLHPTEKGWCVMGCIKRKTGVMGADNKINLDKLEQGMAPMKEHHAERYQKIMSAFKACKPQVEATAANLSNTCKAAEAIGVCVHSKL